jgi:hypothetical protein
MIHFHRGGLCYYSWSSYTIAKVSNRHICQTNVSPLNKHTMKSTERNKYWLEVFHPNLKTHCCLSWWIFSVTLNHFIFDSNIYNEGLSPSCTALSFDGFGSISWHSIWFLAFFFLQLHNFIFSDFQLFRPEYHWRDFINRNAHLVHQNLYRISFTF